MLTSQTYKGYVVCLRPGSTVDSVYSLVSRSPTVSILVTVRLILTGHLPAGTAIHSDTATTRYKLRQV